MSVRTLLVALAAKGFRSVALQAMLFDSDQGGEQVLKACDAKALLNSNRQQTCEAIARVMVEGGRELITAALGAAIGKRLGWPAEQVDAVRAEQQGLQLTYLDPGTADHDDLVQPYSCAATTRLRARLAGVQALGERGWLRQQRRNQGAASAPVTPCCATPPPHR